MCTGALHIATFISPLLVGLYMDQLKEKTTTGGDFSQNLPRRQLSGAARRRLRKEKMLASALAAGEPGTSGPGTSKLQGTTTAATKPAAAARKPNPSGSGTSTAVKGKKPMAARGSGRGTESSKRTRSDGSTPEAARRHQKRRRGAETTTPYAEVAADYYMAIVPDGFPASLINEEQSELIKSALLAALNRAVAEFPAGSPAPRFSGVNLRGGSVRAACADQFTMNWLKRVVANSVLWEGAKLKVIEAKDLPKPIRVMAWVPGPREEPELVLRKLSFQNPGLTTENWAVVDEKPDPKGRQLIILMGKLPGKRSRKQDVDPSTT